MSYYPTYSGDWSNAFPITDDTDLPFLLTVEDMRWQVRMTSTDAAVSPQLDELTVNHAPIQFPASGKAVTLPIGPPDGPVPAHVGRPDHRRRHPRRHRRERHRRG